MPTPDTTWVTNFLWGIADDVLRDVFARGKYRDVILPMVVLRRLDVVLEPTKQAVLDMHERLNEMGITEQEQALRVTSHLPFYNTSKFSLKDLRHRSKQQQLRADFEDWLNGFSTNVQDIIENFEFRNHLNRLTKADALGSLIEKFLDTNLKLAELDNHAMGTVFEELVRKFNEANNEEAGEHWTPRDVVQLMANLIFRPIADQVTDGTYLLYDAAIGTGGMLTVAEQTLRHLGEQAGKKVVTHLYGQEINPETYAICKADLLLSGEGEEADNIVGGAEYSTLSNDAFSGRRFDFMLSNPPYGKSWKTDLEAMGGKDELSDPRFIVEHAGDPEFTMLPRSSDGQMLFLANLASKMKEDTSLGSRAAEIHSGSSLFTGDAGSGESNVRRYLFERDLVEAIIQVPENMFYNTGIATYIWVLANRKPEHRRGKVQLIDASRWFTSRPRNLGSKARDFSAADIERITSTFLEFTDGERSRVFPNEAFGYRKVKVERPLRLRSELSQERIEDLLYASGDAALRREIRELVGDAVFDDFDAVKARVEEYLTRDEEEEETASVPAKTRARLLDGKKWERDRRLHQLATRLAEGLGDGVFDDHNVFVERVDAALKARGVRLAAGDRKAMLRGVSWTDPGAPVVVKRVSKPDRVEPNRLFGRYEQIVAGKRITVEFEPDPDLSDFEQVPLLEPGGVSGFVEREVWPYASDAWVDERSERIGFEISFTRVFYEPTTIRPLTEIEADIRKHLEVSDGLVLKAIGDCE